MARLKLVKEQADQGSAGIIIPGSVQKTLLDVALGGMT